MGNGTERVPPEGTWARLIYDLRRVERTSQEGVRAGWYDPRSPNYRGQRFGFEDVDYSVLTQGRNRAATPEEIARRQQYAEIYGANIGSQATGPGKETISQATGPGKETISPPVTELPGRQMGGFWDRNQINPGRVIGYDPMESFNAWQAQQRSEKFAAPDWWLEMYGPGAKPVLGGKLSAANQRVQNRFLANRKQGQVDANGNPLPEPPGGGIERPSHDMGEPADLSWIENYNDDRYGRNNPYGLSEKNTERYADSGGTDAGAMNRWGQALGTEAPLNAFGGAKRAANVNAKSRKWARKRQAAKTGMTRTERRAAKQSEGSGSKFTNPPNRTEGGAYARPNDLINWTW